MSRMVWLISSSVSESREDVGLVEYEQLRVAQQGPGDGETLLFSARYFHATFADHRIENRVRPATTGPARRAWRRTFKTFFVCGLWLDEEEILADRSGE